MTRRIRLDLAYDGTSFAGWQIQPERRTVQGVVARVLSRLHGERPVDLRGAGRTDAGVHARGQVADCAITTEMDDGDLAHALRCMLPVDVRAWRVRTVPAEFDARRSARGKTYRYTLDRTTHGDPFRARYALYTPGTLDEQLVREGLRRLPGRRDWSGFVARGCEIDERTRTLSEARLEIESADVWHLVFRADGFLRYMVRNLAGTLIEIGRGKMAVDRIDEILDRRDRVLAGPTAPPYGLCLEHVAYDDDLPAGRLEG